jgi:predicted GIY-YIG superfamily endonuclease
MKSGIYKITNTLNGKCYIGVSKDVEKRIAQHERYFGEDRGHDTVKQLYFAFKETPREY